MAFASKTLNDSRRKYCTTKKELYAVVYYMKYWASLVSGGDLTVRTDHHSLLWLLKFGKRTGNTPGMYFRWAAQVTTHSMVRTLRIIHRPGKEHQNADGMSRMVKADVKHLRIPDGTKMNGCYYPKCVDCATEKAMNDKARGSDSDDSEVLLIEQGDVDFDTPVGYEVTDANDLPVHCILQLRLIVQLQLEATIDYETGETLFIENSEAEGETLEGSTLLVLNVQVPERRSARIAEQATREPERRSARIAEQRERKQQEKAVVTEVPVIPEVSNTKGPGKGKAIKQPKRRDPSPKTKPEVETVKDQTVVIDPLSTLEAKIERLQSQLYESQKALIERYPEKDPAKAIRLIQMGTQVDAYDLKMQDTDSEGRQLLDEQM